ncbi:MAG TPA: TonB-dependent receptor [Terriglobia bacterium]|nr:TonB-dependent receptor [Terriglobia bacterium]
MLVNRFFTRARCVLSLLVIFATGILSTSAVYAQVAGATLTGTVTDPAGAVIPRVQVSIMDVATGVTRNVVTDNAGLYNAPNLLPGNYEVTITVSGFSTQVRSGITLTVGARQVLDVTMRVGEIEQKIQVVEEAPQVQLTSSTIGSQVNATTVRELPLNGRSWTDLTNLQPGVVTAETHASGDPNRGFGAQVSISGARPQQNNYRLDGISINDYANGGPGSVLGGNLGVDAIQEFSVLTSNYSAEYGKTSGGVVNAITRSGTNRFHGSAYEFLRNSALDARNFFDGARVPPFKRNQFGAAAGGPIRKDRTFIFGDYEGIRQSLGITRVNTVLSPAARAGNLAAGAVTVDPLVSRYLAIEPLPNAGLRGNGDTGIFTFAGQQIVNENFFTSRVDQKISDRDSLFGTYSFDNSPLTQPDTLGNVLQHAIAKRQIVSLEESRIFSPTFVNSVRLGYNRAHTTSAGGIAAINPAAADPALGWAPGLTATYAQVTGLTLIGPGVAPPIYQFVWNAYQVYDDAFLTRGLHSLKFGGGVERNELNQVTNTADFLGRFFFGNLRSFLTNAPSRVRGVIPSLATPRGMRVSIFGAYFQDDWRWRPNFTLNVGVRYEGSTVPNENQGKLTNLLNITDAQPHLGAPYFSNPTRHNFEPRVGFAWDPFRNGKTAIRGGFGLFDVLPMLYQTITLNGRGAPFFRIGSTSTLPVGSFPKGGLASLGTGSLEYAYVENKPHRNYVMQWNLNIQREVVRDLTAVISYVGSRGVHQPFRIDDANMVVPTRTREGFLWPSPIGSGTLINPNAGAIRYVNWGGDSFYDALQIGIMKRMSHGLQVQGSYTWGKSIDSNSGVIAGDTLGNSVSSLQWFDLKLNRAVSDYNIPRTLVINASWQLPTSSSASRALAWATNGWELGGIFKVNDGPPFTPTFGTDGDPLGLKSSDPYDFPNRLTGPGCASLVNPANPKNYVKTECFTVPTAPSAAFYSANCDPSRGTFPQCFNLRGNAGRNILEGPGLANLDFSLFKNNLFKGISEDFNAQFRVEVFNILNHPNFGPPTLANSQIFDSTGALNANAGLLTSTTTSARQIQFALKFIW